ncbi:type II toxin-antitoxin system HicB family antitoxin [Phyllobacterium sp. 628]|uniref:type II toxin-antitoxin system HicB family antitoxin n=1 Tax=Phyllobacterium sp. 628 TaxID=2718938 RepID=UPI0016625688|nr:type II toxin-antitoxin system HicB family antitoxin [Phyllobacterium sp. 628]QND52145.1 type II toxin-antitoxin system HicB family antitoxin [Phyllobacterium sp. 628]
MQYSYRAKIEADPDGGFLVTFPDVPEALTHGGDLCEARENATEALGLALRGYLAYGKDPPMPSAGRSKGMAEIPVEATDALKLAVIAAFKSSGLSKSELARQLGKGETEARRILDPDHPTKLPLLEAALAALGKKILISVLDAA